MSRRGGLVLLIGALLATAGALLAHRFLADDGGPGGSERSGRGAGASSDGRAPATSATAELRDPRLPPTLTEPTPPDAARTDEMDAIARLELRVRVVDRGGAPVAGIPVALGTLDSKRREPRAVARSGDDGIARLTGYGDSLRTERAGAEWCVYFPFPEAEAHLEPVDPWRPSSEPIELIAPELGRLIVKVEDGAGAPLRASGELTLFSWPAGGGGDKSARATPIACPLTAPGELVVDPIATGVRVRVDAWLAEYASASVEGDGPQRAGATATLTLVVPRHGPIVIGQLVGPDGRPVADARLIGTIHDDPQLRMGFGDAKLATDGEGRFRFDASKYELEEPTRPRWLDLVGGLGHAAGIAGRARAALPTPFASGEHDVGRVEYELAPLVVAGRVVDERGEPVAEAQVRVGRTQLAGVDGLRLGGAGDILSGSSGADGAFELHGFLPPAGWIVVATTRSVAGMQARLERGAPERWMESPTLPFALGERGVTLVVRGCGAVEGSLVMDPAIDSIHVGLFLRRADAPDGRREAFDMVQAPGRDGTFRWNRVVAGRVDVAVGIGRYSRTPEIVVVVPDVEVAADVVNRDPRIAAIDLRARVPKVRVELYGPDGAPLENGVVALLSGEEPPVPVLTVLVDHGAAELPTQRATFDVEVRAAGLRVERRFGLTSPARIDLRGGIPVELALDPPLLLERRGAITLRLTMTPADAARAGGGGQLRLDLEGDGSAHVLASEPGRFRVDLEASQSGGLQLPAGQSDAQIVASKKRWFELQERLDRAFGTPALEVHEGAIEQRILVPLPLAAREAIEQMVREFGGG